MVDLCTLCVCNVLQGVTLDRTNAHPIHRNATHDTRYHLSSIVHSVDSAPLYRRLFRETILDAFCAPWTLCQTALLDRLLHLAHFVLKYSVASHVSHDLRLEGWPMARKGPPCVLLERLERRCAELRVHCVLCGHYDHVRFTYSHAP